MQTIETIMEEMERRVRENESISPGSWVEVALRINQLGGDIDNLLANYEAEMIAIEAEYIKSDMPASKAKVLAKSQIDYKEYLIQKALFNRIKEFIMLAKKRSTIEQL
jgi:Holliday junction resolvasome RuvABC endonuclease subunit